MVLPVPGGPHRMAEVSRSDSMRARSGAPGPTRCCWPTISSRVRGRIRAASGARADSRSAAAPEKRSSPATTGRSVLRREGPEAELARARPGATGLGAPVIGSDPDWVFGKAMTSRMLSSPAKMATNRSMPTANPAWGGAPYRKAPSRNPKRDCGLLVVDAQHGEDPALDVRPVDPDAARAQLPPVEHQVVGLGPHRGRIGLEPVEVVGMGHGEGMVGGHRMAGLVHPVEQREVHHPQVAVRPLARPGARPGRRGAGRGRCRPAGTRRPPPGPGRRPRRRWPPAGPTAPRRRGTGRAASRDRGPAHRRRLALPGGDPEPGQALGPELPRPVGQAVQPGPAERRHRPRAPAPSRTGRRRP